MIIKIKIRANKKVGKNQIFAWIQNKKDWREEIQVLLRFFEKEIILKKRIRLHSYYKVTSKIPGTILSFLTSLIDLVYKEFP